MRKPPHLGPSLVAALGVVLVLAACGGTSDNTAGGPLPNQRDGESYPGVRSEVTGQVLQTDNGCLYVVTDRGRQFAVWPRGAEQARDDARVVLLVDGNRVAPGDQVVAQAVTMPVTDLVGVPDGYWGNQLAFCAPDARAVLVLDSVQPQPVTRPPHS